MARASRTRHAQLRRHFRISPRAAQAFKYFVVLAALILFVVLLIIVFKGLRTG